MIIRALLRDTWAKIKRTLEDTDPLNKVFVPFCGLPLWLHVQVDIEVQHMAMLDRHEPCRV